MATPQYEYYMEMLKNLIKVNHRKGEPLSNERLIQSVIDVREETDTEHECNINKSHAMIHISILLKRKMYQQSMIPYIMSRVIT